MKSTQEQRVDIAHRFTFHPADEAKGERHEGARRTMLRAAEWAIESVPPGREQSLVLTHLEDAMMWANAGIARNP